MPSYKTIQPPLAGIVRSRGFQKQPPFSSRDSINFWPQFAIDGSNTLAIRPPLDEFIAVATNPVNMMVRVNGTNSQTPQRTFLVAVNGVVQKWTGSALEAVGGSGTAATGRALFAAAFEQKVYIPGSTSLKYDYPTNTLSTWTATNGGTLPADMRILVFWAGGLWGSGQPTTPHIVHGCKTGDPLNWDNTGETPASAFSTIGTNAGLISDPVTAMIPASGDTMIVSCPDSMQAWRGHPRRGGVADILSPSIGVRGQGAWTLGPDEIVYAITNKGLVGIQGANVVQLISADRVPNSLIGYTYDYLDPRISMAYDARFNGIHITVRGSDAASSEGWFYDLKNNGLHEQEFAQYPYVMLRMDPLGTGRASEVLFGGLGGLYRHDLDGTETYAARIVMGPMKLSDIATQRSKIQEAQVVFGGGTTAVDAKVAFYCGPTADSAYAAAVSGNAAAKYETTVERIMKSQGRVRPMVAGHAMAMVVEQETAMENPKIIIEETNLTLNPAGRERGYVQHSDTSGPLAGSFIPPGPAIPPGSPSLSIPKDEFLTFIGGAPAVREPEPEATGSIWLRGVSSVKMNFGIPFGGIEVLGVGLTDLGGGQVQPGIALIDWNTSATADASGFTMPQFADTDPVNFTWAIHSDGTLDVWVNGIKPPGSGGFGVAADMTALTEISFNTAVGEVGAALVYDSVLNDAAALAIYDFGNY